MKDLKETPEGVVSHCVRCGWDSTPKETEPRAKQALGMHIQSAHTRGFRKKRDAAVRQALAVRTLRITPGEPDVEVNGAVNGNGHPNKPKRKYTRRQPELTESALLRALEDHPYCWGCGKPIKPQLVAGVAIK